MVKTLLAIVQLLHRAPLLEFAGAAAITAGFASLWGLPGGLLSGGGFALLKALDLDLQGKASTKDR